MQTTLSAPPGKKDIIYSNKSNATDRLDRALNSHVQRIAVDKLELNVGTVALWCALFSFCLLLS